MTHTQQAWQEIGSQFIQNPTKQISVYSNTQSTVVYEYSILEAVGDY